MTASSATQTVGELRTDYLARARSRLLPCDFAGEGSDMPIRVGDHILNPGQLEATAARDARPAAVLIALVARAEGTTVLLTQRAASLRSHSGQIAFPGGRIDGVETPVEAALREAQEEIGLDPACVEPVGRLDSYLSGSGFRIVPIVAQVHPPFSLTISDAEVADAFEVPFDFLMDAANHHRESREWKGIERHYYAMPWKERYIWGVTAGILRNLYERIALP